MQSFASLVLERGAASEADVQSAIVGQLLFGGDVGTNLVELGALKENTLHRLLSEHYEMPIGPRGRLPDPDQELIELLPFVLARHYRVYPVKRTRRALHVAASQPLDPVCEQELRNAVGMQLKTLLVTELRLNEALSRCGLPMCDRERKLVDTLEAGIRPARKRDPEQRAPESMMFHETAPYRRMSERPSGIGPSQRQPKPRPRRAPRLPETIPPGDSIPPGDTKPPPVHHTAPPDTLDGVGPESYGTPAPESSGTPASESEPSSTGEPPDTLDGVGQPSELKGPMPLVSSSVPPPTKERDTHPYETESPDDMDGEKDRDTQPWRDDENDQDEAALSVRGEFTASLSEKPPSDEAKILEEHRVFRHRGPFTRAQAELAANQAPDVQVVLEVLVRYARQFFERTVLLVVQGERATLRLAHGLKIEWASFQVPLDAPSVVKEAFDSGDPVVRRLDDTGVDADIKKKLRVGGERVAVVPISVRERVVALFYGDDRDDGVDKDAVADVTDFAEICAAEIMRVIVERKKGARPRA